MSKRGKIAAVCTWFILVIACMILVSIKPDIINSDLNNFRGGLLYCLLAWLPSIAAIHLFD